MTERVDNTKLDAIVIYDQAVNYGMCKSGQRSGLREEHSLQDDNQAYWHVGVDVGGTFTDIVLFSDDGAMQCYKIPSNRPRPAQSTLKGIDQIIADHGLDVRALRSLLHTHGNTIAVNTLIERNGARLGLITTRGFKDVFELGRLAIPHPMRFDSRRADPLVERSLCCEVSARLDASGTELVPLDPAEVAEASDVLVAQGVEVIIVCFLHSYRNPEHERRARDLILQRHPKLLVDLSSEVWPQAREYERAVLSSINSYVRPAMDQFVDDLTEGLNSRGISIEPAITRSNGGKQRATTIRRSPIASFLSGPAGGVMAAAIVAEEAGWDRADLITVDMGGTSADVGVIRDGQPLLSTDEHVAGLPLITPTIAVSSIGAGGGSVIWLDETGTLKVGPKSVGSDPGPACYGTGGKMPALTDAFILAGWLADGQKLAGTIPLTKSLAVDAFAPIANGLRVPVEAVAEGAIAIAIAVMAAETSNVVSRRGVDAPEFSMVAFGGAGPLLGALLAEEVGIERVLVPLFPGALSAVGAAGASVEGDLIYPVYQRLDQLDPDILSSAAADLAHRGQEWLDHENEALPIADRTTALSAEMRYAGQGYDVTVRLDPAWLEEQQVDLIAAEFHRAHLSTYGHSDPKAPIWLSEIRSHIVGQTPRPARQVLKSGQGAREAGKRNIVLKGKEVIATVYNRHSLDAGASFEGPAIIEQYDTTTVVPTNWVAKVSRSGSIVLEHK